MKTKPPVGLRIWSPNFACMPGKPQPMHGWVAKPPTGDIGTFTDRVWMLPDATEQRFPGGSTEGKWNTAPEHIGAGKYHEVYPLT